MGIPTTVMLQDYAIGKSKSMINNLKIKFGKSYSFTTMDSIVFIFLSKYNKKFMTLRKQTHDFIGLHMDDTLSNSKIFIKFDEATFGIYRSGIYCEEYNNSKSDSRSRSCDARLYIFGRHYVKYCKQLEKMLRHSVEGKIEMYTYSVDSQTNTKDIRYTDIEGRNENSIFFENNEFETVCNHIDRFMKNNEMYIKKQLNYKTGILLHVEPGTGKSNIVKVLATKYHRHIINISVNYIEHLDLNWLSELINNEDPKHGSKYIVLLEDIDTLFLNRTDDVDSRKVINKLLQFLDSNSSPNNVIFIATTNYIDRLDSALLRDGRFDLKCEIKPLTNPEVIYKFAKSFGVTKDQVNKSIILGEKYPQLYLQNVFLKLKEQEL